MIWHYFPIGMRFPVADFSEETRLACWKTALSAAYASDARGTGLYEACESFDPVTQSPVYVCIICYVGIKQARAAGECMHALDPLMTRLCLCNPLVQANYLENFGPYPILAEIDAEGTIRPGENGANLFPKEPVVPMQPTNGSRILIAPDSMKGVCSAECLTRILGTAAADHGFRVRRMSVADGGEGTVAALIAGTDGRYETVFCEDLNGERVAMTVGVIPGPVAVIETADAVGFARKTELTPPIGRRSSFGVGALIKKTLDLGYRRIWIGLGGSLTVDLGLGALSALGIRFLDTEGEPVVPCPETFARIAKLDRESVDPRLAETELTLLYDVAAPLCGEEGALKVFGPQKGASEEQIHTWEKEFIRLASLLGGDPSAPGSGAAGGLGFALASVGGTLQSGAERILDRIGLKSALSETDFVITGEGCLDTQSVRFRKAPVHVADQFCCAGKPGCLFVGRLGTDAQLPLRNRQMLKDIVFCPSGEEPYEVSVRRSFEQAILPMIAKDVVNKTDL